MPQIPSSQLIGWTLAAAAIAAAFWLLVPSFTAVLILLSAHSSQCASIAMIMIFVARAGIIAAAERIIVFAILAAIDLALPVWQLSHMKPSVHPL